MRILSICYYFYVHLQNFIYEMRMAFYLKNYKFSTGEYGDKNVIFVHFPNDLLLRNELRLKFPVAKWSFALKCWYLPDVDAVRKEINMTPKTELGKDSMSQISPINQPAIKRMYETLLLKGYSTNTIKTYCKEFSQLLHILKNLHVDTLTPERLRSYFLYCTLM
jgi:hypothetical protein